MKPQLDPDSTAVQLDILADDVEEWRSFFHCRPVSKLQLETVTQRIGFRRPSEPLDRWMERVFRALSLASPENFTKPMKSDPFELAGPPAPRISVWLIARGVFWGLLMFYAFLFFSGMLLAIVAPKLGDVFEPILRRWLTP